MNLIKKIKKKQNRCATCNNALEGTDFDSIQINTSEGKHTMQICKDCADTFDAIALEPEGLKKINGRSV